MRRMQIAFVGILVMAVVVTWIQTVFPFVHVRPLDEYRKPAPVPDIVAKLTLGDGRIAADINAWFDDRHGFRSLLARVSNQIDYSVFNYSKKVLIGKDGWLFDRAFFSFVSSYTRSSNGLRTEKEKVAEIAAFLKRRGIRLVVISTPAKETVYRELLPANAPPGPAVSEFEKFRSYLNEGDGDSWIHIDSQRILVGAKSQGIDLYYRTDLHATTFGSMLVAQELIHRLAVAEGTNLAWQPHLELVRQSFDVGSEWRFLALLSGRPEMPLEVHHDGRYDPDKPPPSEFFEKSPSPPYEVVFHNESGRPTLPPTILFGTSFLDRYLFLGAYSSFKDVYRARGTGDLVVQALQNIPNGTKYFIFEY